MGHASCATLLCLSIYLDYLYLLCLLLGLKSVFFVCFLFLAGQIASAVRKQRAEGLVLGSCLFIQAWTQPVEWRCPHLRAYFLPHGTFPHGHPRALSQAILDVSVRDPYLSPSYQCGEIPKPRLLRPSQPLLSSGRWT